MASVVLTEDQFQALLRSLGSNVTMSGFKKKRLDPKHMKLNDFSGMHADWSDWAFSFRRAIRGADVEVYDLMEKVERATADFDEQSLNEFTENGDVGRVSGELYDILCTVLKGEALSLIRTIDECQGFRAWHKLYIKYNPKTMARAIKLMSEVASPGHVKKIGDVEGALQAWSMKLKMLERQFEETVGPKMKIAIMTGMMPQAIQDFIYQNVTADTTFEGLMDKIKVWISNRVAMDGVPMDIGSMENKEWRDEFYQESNEEEEIYAMGKGAKGGGKGPCHTCGETGHYSRECPKGKARGKGKDGMKGGFKGECWNCGEHGHSAKFCTKGAGKGYGKEGYKGNYKGDHGKGYGKDGYKFKGYQYAGKGGKGGWHGVHGFWEDASWNAGPVQLFGVETAMDFQVPKHAAKKTPVLPPGLGMKLQNRFGVLDMTEELDANTDIVDEDGAAKLRSSISDDIASTNPPATRKIASTNPPATQDREKMADDKGIDKQKVKIMNKKGKLHTYFSEEDMDEDGIPLMALFSPEQEVNHVRRAPQWVKLEAVVDSGAAESVAPESMAPWVPKQESEGSKRGQTYLSASGDKLPNLGEKKFDMMTAEGHWAQATFQVAEVTRPLCSVSKMCDKGNRVVFEMSGGYVENLATGVRTSFSRENNVYVMEMHVQDDGAVSAPFGRQA
jgi:hypothetical protein